MSVLINIQKNTTGSFRCGIFLVVIEQPFNETIVENMFLRGGMFVHCGIACAVKRFLVGHGAPFEEE